jgi:hypothetical protein
MQVNIASSDRRFFKTVNISWITMLQRGCRSVVLLLVVLGAVKVGNA